MNILLKTTLKNTFGKPLRSLVVIFSIFVCSLAALFCFDLVQMEQGVINSLLSEALGEANLSVMGIMIGEGESLPEDLPEYKALYLRKINEVLYEDIEGEYNIVTTDEFNVSGVDVGIAHEMGYIDTSEIKTGEIVVTDKYADEFGYVVGDTISIHDKVGDPHDFKICEIVVANPKKLLLRGKSGVINEEDADMLYCHKTANGNVMIDIIDNSKIGEAETILKERYGKDNVQNYELGEDMEELMNELFGLLFILFAVAFLLVIFVTASICERIVSERMSFVGTLRSLGMSTARTVRILLMENVAYALIGSVPGVILYSCIRPMLEDSMFNVSDASGEVMLELTVPDLSIGLVLGVIIGAVLIECLIPLKSIIKAMKTSIRDIIFDNRDTEYKLSKSSIITGFVFLIITIISFFGKSMLAAGICLVAAVVSLALLYPLILMGASGLLGRLSEKTGDAKLSLALREAVSRKSTVGSGVLCATSAAMCIIIITLSSALGGYFNQELFSCDVIVNCSSMSKYYSFIPYLDGVTDTEYVYNTMQGVYFGDEEKEEAAQIFGYPDGGYKYYNGLHEMPGSVEPGTVCVEKSWAERNGKSIGDPVTITFDPVGVFPVKKEFTIAAFYKMDSSESLKNDIVIAESEFIDIYHDNPGYLLINSDNPDATRDDIKKYAVGKYSDVKTREELIEQNKKESATSKRIYDLVIGVAILMTFIGMVSNQTIGFEGRKKECAVMISTSMTGKTLAGILFREMLITSFVSSTAGSAMGMFLFAIISRAINNSQNVVLPLDADYTVVIKLWIMMTVIFTLSVLFPVKHMKKMKLAEQLKYE